MTRAGGRVLQKLRQLLRREVNKSLADAQLLEDFVARRDEAAFTALVARHGPMVLGVCQRVLGNSHDAADANSGKLNPLSGVNPTASRRSPSVRTARLWPAAAPIGTFAAGPWTAALIWEVTR